MIKRYHSTLLRTTTNIVGAVILTLMLVACERGGEPTAVATPTTRPAPTVVQASPTPTVKQELRVNLGAEPKSLDPQLATSLPEWSVIRQVFRGLLGFKPDLSLESVVATEVPTVENGGISVDGLVYTFRLREDVTWSDGKEVTAGDFAYGIKRLLDPEVAAPYSFLYLSIEGGQEYNTAVEADISTRQTLRDAVGIEALDEHTLRITLASPNPTFLQKMALVNVYPVRQDVIESSGDEWTEAGNYIGNGPYTMTEWVHQDHITLEINPSFWGARPKLDRIVFRMISDTNSELAAYRSNELELARVPPGTEAATLANPVLGQEVLRSSDLFTFGLFFNTAVAPFDDLKVRQAFAAAIDREAWVDQVSNGVGKPATGWLPPGMPGYDPELGKEYAFNPQRAKQLLDESDYPAGEGFPPVTLTLVSEGPQRIIAEFIQAQIRDNLGVEISLETLDPPAYFQQVMGARQFQITGIGWGADYPDPESFLAPLFMTGSPNNISQYSNSEFDRLAGMAFTELDQQRRLDLWKSAHEVLVEDVPVAFLFYQERFFLKKPQVQGLTLTGIDGFIPGDTRLSDVSIAP